MNMTSFSKTAFSNTFLAASLAMTLGSVAANAVAADQPQPQAHSDGMGAAISDTVITAKVKAKLMGEKGLKKSEIDVTTTNGVVTLTGSASNSDAKGLAEDMTKSVEGVKSVDNALKTPAGSEASAKTHKAMEKTKRVVADSWITTKVKSEILADSLTKGFDVNVETRHGVVILKGKLANQAAVDHVKVMAQNVDGVKSVDASGLKVGAQ
ncbi:MAG: BON domain-containing protein [Sulfuriferula sp.]